ncbi:Diaminopimelate decarboxylase [Serratia fonticola]|uniref:Diaminopimelate decarboxylase n=1 Tax=Serratia fonticola TaxID=47917 RepID=A0A4U9VBW3_SERFO|nr:Diaminopimelate decarboxylase [Serratia fonticola]
MPRALNDTSTALNAANLLALPQRFGCPVWAYDADIISQRISQLQHFDVIRFAQKACSNIHILRLMREQGVKVDSVSLGEIERALKAGFEPGWRGYCIYRRCAGSRLRWRASAN